jgi:acetyl-CoA carboxylase carboxyltransferase component
MGLEKTLNELQERKDKAILQGGYDKIKAKHDKGSFTARERIDLLLDPSTFIEFGMLASSDMPGMEDKTPADGLIMGFGHLNGRQIGVIANDFTVQGSSNARVYTKKAAYMRNKVTEKGFPLVWLGEASGGRLPDVEGAKGLCSLASEEERSVFPQYVHKRETLWITAAMGGCYGVPTWQACLSDFVVQVKGSIIAVSGPRHLQRLIFSGSPIEEMGGWKIHAEITGLTDQVAEDENDCIRIIKEFFDHFW